MNYHCNKHGWKHLLHPCPGCVVYTVTSTAGPSVVVGPKNPHTGPSLEEFMNMPEAGPATNIGGICGVDSKHYQELLETQKAYSALKAECERLKSQIHNPDDWCSKKETQDLLALTQKMYVEQIAALTAENLKLTEICRNQDIYIEKLERKDHKRIECNHDYEKQINTLTIENIDFRTVIEDYETAIKFYANVNNWIEIDGTDGCLEQIRNDSHIHDNGYSIGGKLARAVLSKHDKGTK